MSNYETLNSQKVIEVSGAYCIGLTEDENGELWFHVCERATDGLYYSIYRAASYEDALDVLSIYF